MYLFGSINERFMNFKKDYSNYVYNLNMIFSFEAYFVITIFFKYSKIQFYFHISEVRVGRLGNGGGLI